jgi:hypothetical protein
MSSYSDRFKKYAAKARNRQGFDATLLKFGGDNGNWTSGKKPDVVDRNGRRLGADVPDMMHGHLKFADNLPIYDLCRVDSDVVPRPREALGDLDKNLWRNGEDPWRWIAALSLFDLETHEIFLFTTSSMGGLDATGVLAEAYADNVAAHPEDVNRLPVVELASDSYVNTKGKKIFNPIFDIVDWAERPAGIRRLKPPPPPPLAIEEQGSLDFDEDGGSPDGDDTNIPF